MKARSLVFDLFGDFLRYRGGEVRLRGLIALRRGDPDEALISALIRARDESGALSENELTAMIFLMIIAGHDTTLSLIGSGAAVDHRSDCG